MEAVNRSALDAELLKGLKNAAWKNVTIVPSKGGVPSRAPMTAGAVVDSSSSGGDEGMEDAEDMMDGAGPHPADAESVSAEGDVKDAGGGDVEESSEHDGEVFGWNSNEETGMVDRAVVGGHQGSVVAEEVVEEIAPVGMEGAAEETHGDSAMGGCAVFEESTIVSVDAGGSVMEVDAVLDVQIEIDEE